MVAQLIGASKLMLLLWGPELHMGLGIVWGDPQDQESAVPNVGAGQSAMLGIQQDNATGTAAFSACCRNPTGSCLHNCSHITLLQALLWLLLFEVSEAEQGLGWVKVLPQ